MDLEDQPPPSTPGRALEWLRDCGELASVDAPTLEALAAASVYFSLPAGGVLFETHMASDGVYLLASGRLGVNTAGAAALTAEIERGELVGEAGWLLQQPRSARVVALRDCELLLLPGADLDRIAQRSSAFSLALAKVCARRLRRSNRQDFRPRRARAFAIVPSSLEVDVAELATGLVDELSQLGRTELVWDARAGTHTTEWFNRIEEYNDFVVYIADWTGGAWTRQCCRQADVLLLLARAAGERAPWPPGLADHAAARGARVELVLMHEGRIEVGAARRWLETPRVALHHHVVQRADLGRLARLLTRRGVGLVLSGGGARGFAHLGVIRALREARVPLDFVGGSSIGAVIAAGVAMGWDDEEMRRRYRRTFVDSNPVNDYTVPLLALTRGRKVTRLLEREYGATLIEDLRLPFFCMSANLTTGRALEHRDGSLARALRAAVAIPGVLPPVFHEAGVLVDGAAINNLPVDVMKAHAPGILVGSDVGADRGFGSKRINIIQVLMHAGMINSGATATAQRELADVLLKPPLGDIDLLNWRAFDRAIETGYRYTRSALEELAALPRLNPVPVAPRPSSLMQELERRIAALANA